MSRSLLLAAIFALTCTGCGSSLQNAIRVANALGTVASSAGDRVNADFARDDRACLWQPNGQPSTSSLTVQTQCLATVRSAYGPALKAYDAFLATWTAFTFAIRSAEAAEILGRAGDPAKLEALLPDVIRTADEFTAAIAALLAPVKAVP